MSAARRGEARQEVLVEIRPDSKGRRHDAFRAKLRRDCGERVGIGRADVGLAVGQEEHAVRGGRGVGRDMAQHFVRAFAPAGMEVGAAARIDLRQPSLGDRLGFRRCRRALEHDIDLVRRNTTMARRSRASSRRMACATASRASSIFCPPIDPERSSTSATLTGVRSALRGFSGAVTSTVRKRVDSALATIRARSVSIRI